MKCGLCHEGGHNRTTCTKAPRPRTVSELSRLPPDEAMRLLIDPAHALVLVTEGKAAEALANATRRIGELDRDGLGHLASSDILTALAELELKARQLPSIAIQRLRSTDEAIEAAKAALADAERDHARAKAEVLHAIGYQEAAKALGFRVALVEAETSS